MAYPATQETHTNVTDNVTDIVAEHVNWGYGVVPRIEDYVGYTTDTADPNGSITARVMQLEDDVVGFSFPIAEASSTHGPVSLAITDSSPHNMVAAPGTGVAVYVTSIAAWNEDVSASRLSASDGTIRFRARLAGTDGAGFVHAFDPPWELPENTALSITMDVPITSALVTVNFYTAAPTV